jgi:hypothetical protein
MLLGCGASLFEVLLREIPDLLLLRFAEVQFAEG